MHRVVKDTAIAIGKGRGGGPLDAGLSSLADRDPVNNKPSLIGFALTTAGQPTPPQAWRGKDIGEGAALNGQPASLDRG